MRLYIKQKVFSLTAQFNVKDETGFDKYFVQGEFFSMKGKMHIFDSAGNEVALIYRRLMTFMPHFIVEVGGQQVAEIVKEFSFLVPKYHLIGTPLRLEGDFLDHQYFLSDGQRMVMQVNKEWFTWGDSYVINYDNPADEILALSIVLAVDCVMAAQRSN